MFHRTKLARSATRGALSIAVAVLALLRAPSAGANPAFPTTLKETLGMPCVPDCTVCHIDDKGGYGTLRFITNKAGMMMQKGFAKELQSRAMGMLDGGDASSLAPSLAFVRSMPPLQDVDGDGIDDFTELSTGSDPNDFTPGASVCGPVYGCGRIAKPGPVDNVAAVTAAAVASVGISLLRRRR